MPPKHKTSTRKKVGRKRPTRAQGTFPRTKRTPQHGAYVPTYDKPGVWGKAGRAVGGILGGHFGGRPGADLGARVGGLAHYIGRLFGSGDYRIGAPPAMNSLFQGGGSAAFPYQRDLSFGEKAVVIKHREYLGDVYTASTANTFQTTNFQVNPGLSATFPWLSMIASAFQLYKWRGIVVEFKSKSADALNSVNTALGSVILAADYNAATFGQQFNNKTEMLNYEGAVDCKPSDNMVMGIECDPKRLPLSELYVRTGDVGGNIQNYDTCSFAIATTGFQGTNVNVGELWIAYDVILMTPAMLPLGSTLPAAIYQLDTGTITNPASSTVGQSSWGRLQNPISQVSIYDRLGIVFGFDSSTFTQYVGLRNRSSISDGIIMEFVLKYQGAATANLGVLGLATLAGTTVNNYSIGGATPSVLDWPVMSDGRPIIASATQNDGTMSYSVVRKIGQTRDLLRSTANTIWNVPTGTNTTDFVLIHAHTATNIASATTSVPGTLAIATFHVNILPSIFSS